MYTRAKTGRLFGDVNAEILCTDFAAGVAAAVLAVPLAFLIGGPGGSFVFFEPWVIAITILMLVAGFLRGVSSGRVWIKAAAAGSGLTAMPAVLLHTNWHTVFLLFTTATLPAAGGMFLRRYGTKIRKRTK